MTKKLIMTLYTLVVVCIGFATIIEKFEGTSYVSERIYGAWWFVVLWALLAVSVVVYIVRVRLYRRLAVTFLHASFVVILAGALLTYLTAERGTVNLRTGKAVTSFARNDGTEGRFPFSLELEDFKVVNYPGTDAALDYQSIVDVKSAGVSQRLAISMNNIGKTEGYRLFQSSYDSDGQGVSLGVYHDPYGIAVTYTGYLLLLISIVWTLFSRKTQIRELYRKAVAPLMLIVMLMAGGEARAEDLQVVDKDIAHRMGSINVLYNDRICPLNTVATDFVTKLSGKASWNGYSADEVFVSWMIYYYPWEQQKIIRIKSKEVQKLLGIDGQWAAFSDFIDKYNEYKLKDAVEKMQQGKGNLDRKGLMDADEKYHVVAMFYQGQMLRMFPYSFGGDVKWYSPGSHVLPKEIPVQEQFFIKQSMDFLTESIVTGQKQRALEIIAKIKLFQRDMIGDLLPSRNVTQAEIFYNKVNAMRSPVFLSLLLSLFICMTPSIPLLRGNRLRLSEAKNRLAPEAQPKKASLCREVWWVSEVFIALLIAWLTMLLCMRWWISGHLPLSNGYETMQFMAWAMLVITAVLHRRFYILTGFGTLIASFCLLVAMLASGTPQITQLMPVLQSPLLSVHVMTVMCAYALFALQVLLGISGLWQLHKKEIETVEKTTALSQLLLYPAVFLLAVGIFLGAVWANVSWGTYWSWDPKETWALITLMVYAVPFHRASLRWLASPRVYHWYMVVAFLSVLVTYFGVNYLLGGMHSYA